MRLIIPSSAVQSGIIAGTITYLVVNSAGELTGLFISRVAGGAAAVAGGVATMLAGSVAGTITQEAVRVGADGWFVPAVRSGGRLGALGAAAGAGAITVAAVTLGYHSGCFIINKIQTLRSRGGGDSSEAVEFTVEEDASGEFAVISAGVCGGSDERRQSPYSDRPH
jgi:hypothetical protein